MSTTVSAKIPEELKRELVDAGINVSETIRDALEEEVRRRRRERLRERASAFREERDDSLESDEIAALVREDREDRDR